MLAASSDAALAQQSEARTSILEEEEWEIRKIVGKRRVGMKGHMAGQERAGERPGIAKGT